MTINKGLAIVAFILALLSVLGVGAAFPLLPLAVLVIAVALLI